MQRRTAIKSLGVAGLVTAGVPTAAARRNSLVRKIRDRGWYGINVAGTRPPIDGFYRADRPLRAEINGGGLVQVHPQRGGIYCHTALAEDDAVAGAGFNLGTWPIGGIGEIEVKTDGNPVNVGLWLGDGEFFEWEPAGKGMERLVDLDDDTMAGAIIIGGGSITRTSHTFGGKTLAEWGTELGSSTLARFTVGVFGSRSGEVTVTSFEVEESSGEKTRR